MGKEQQPKDTSSEMTRVTYVGLLTEVRSERESQGGFMKWPNFPQEILKVARLRFMLSVRIGTAYWCLAIKGKTIPET